MSSSKDASVLLRAFGMSGAQIAAEIKALERTQGVKLRDEKEANVTRKLEQFGNFERDIRNEASMMSEYYEIFYCLEISIRRLMKDTFSSHYGATWWEKANVAQQIREEVEKNRKNERENAITPRSDDPLDYTTFGQLSQIITQNFDLFEPIFDSKAAVSRVLYQLNLLRGPIAHCSVLAPDERGRLELAVRDWFRLLS